MLATFCDPTEGIAKWEGQTDAAVGTKRRESSKQLCKYEYVLSQRKYGSTDFLNSGVDDDHKDFH